MPHFSIQRIHLLVSFLFPAHLCSSSYNYSTLVYYTRVGGKCTQHRQVIGINNYCLLPKAVYKPVISENLSQYLSVANLVLKARSIGKL